jgi:glycerol-3-phosphate dehydrogenase
MIREKMLRQAADRSLIWDVAVIGGGATGLGVGVESASRGYRTLVLEQGDFARGTSSRSTKLIHGGVRYLQQGNLSLVMEALHERGILFRNAPHLVRHQSFIVPVYEWWEGPFYGIGLKFYDILAGKMGIGPSRNLSREETLEKIPTLEPNGLRGGIIYFDGQFDDARMAVTLFRTIDDLGGCVLNYMNVISLIKEDGLICGLTAIDDETGNPYTIRARCVINAAGVFVDSIRKMDAPCAVTLISPSQGVHLVLDKSFLPGESAIMVPHTEDGRVLFAVPWHNRVIIGTTDTPMIDPQIEPIPLPEEIDFILTHAARYLSKGPGPEDVLSAFAGLRPLIQQKEDRKTAMISRDHQVMVSPSGLITIAGGKWTTYRKMGEDTVNKAELVAGLEKRHSATDILKLHGWLDDPRIGDPFSIYGADAREITALIRQDPVLGEKIHPHLPYRRAEVIWAVRKEMARRLEDVLSRRTRALLLDARASMEAAPLAAKLMAGEMGKDEAWQQEQVSGYLALAENYLVI